LLHVLYTEINLVGIAILMILLHSLHRTGSKEKPLDQRIFSVLILMNALIFLFDAGMWLTDGRPAPAVICVNVITTTLYYILNPLICFVWLLYTDVKVYESRSALLRRVRLYVIPAAASTLMSAASPFTHWFFVIDGAGRYSRGPLFSVMACISLFYIALSFAYSLCGILKGGWEGNKNVYIHLLLFPVGLVVASVVQILFFGVSIIWVCAMLVAVSIFINIQNGEISTDYLTGLYNRRRLDMHLQGRIRVWNDDRMLFALMLDLDEFKGINDRNGHIAGDNALVATAKLLRRACRNSDDFIARMGGDEFIILGERTRAHEIHSLMEEIKSYADEYNQTHAAGDALLISMGYSLFQKGDTMDTFLAAADKAMYRDKDARRLLRAGERPTA